MEITVINGHQLRIDGDMAGSLEDTQQNMPQYAPDLWVVTHIEMRNAIAIANQAATQSAEYTQTIEQLQFEVQAKENLISSMVNDAKVLSDQFNALMAQFTELTNQKNLLQQMLIAAQATIIDLQQVSATNTLQPDQTQ